jgi:SAM-dependent methyltransferase
VSDERWQDAHHVERAFWSTGGFGLGRFQRTVGGSIETAEWATPHLELPAGDSLEIGIGPLGVGCIHFLKGAGALHVLDPIEPTAADDWKVLPEPCKALVRACQQGATAHVGQAEQLDFPDDAFALVAAENMLDHVQDPGAVLAEARRVLKPGGSLLLTIDTFSALGEARYRLVARRKLRDMIYVRAHPHRFSSKGVVRLLETAGFRITHADIPGRMTAAVGHSCRISILAQ